MYTNLLSDINGVFASTAWTSQNINIYPDNYQGTIATPDEYLRLNVLPAEGDHLDFHKAKSISGSIMIKIFVKAGNGQSRILAISDILDTVLQNKLLTNKTGLGASFTTMEGLDSSNQSLYTATYTIPFKILEI
jgi:hypothetical protein